jgi:hypothetical protein
VYSEAIIVLEQGIPERQVPATMPQGKAIDVRDRQFVVRLKDYFLKVYRLNDVFKRRASFF